MGCNHPTCLRRGRKGGSTCCPGDHAPPSTCCRGTLLSCLPLPPSQVPLKQASLRRGTLLQESLFAVCGRGSIMWRSGLTLCQLFVAFQPFRAQTMVVTPKNCSLECVRQGRPECQYCRVTREDKKALGLNSINYLGDCTPWSCSELLGDEDPTICEHYVQPPDDVMVEFVREPDPHYDTVVLSWKPSPYGIAFLRGFQVSLQTLPGMGYTCQLLLFHRNISLSASDAQTVYKSDPFPGLTLGSKYAVTIIPLPVPEEWDKFYKTTHFTTRSCAEKNGLDRCKKDWYPQQVTLNQNGCIVNVTFNLAPPNLGIRRYFYRCNGDGDTIKYEEMVPNTLENKTHHSFKLSDLHEGTNYTCEIAAKEVDAVRRSFQFHMGVSQKGISPSGPPSLVVVLAFCLALVAIFAVLLGASLWKLKMHRKKPCLRPEMISLYEAEKPEKQLVVLPVDRPAPPHLLICYSGYDGPAHVKAVMQLAAFIQQHMATKVCLDLWDSLNVAKEGVIGWYCRQVRESDFILVICSPGLKQKYDSAEPEVNHDDISNLMSNTFSCEAIIQLIGAEVVRAKARGDDMSKYMAAVFKYCKETDIPIELRLATHYKLPRDLPLVFSHLHGVALHGPGTYLKINNITEEGFTSVPTGAALQLAIQEAGMTLSREHQNRGSVDV